MVAAFIGTLFVIKPTPSNLACFPALIGLLGGLGAGIAYTCVRALGMKGVKGSFIVFFFSAFSCVVTLPYLIFRYHPMTLQQLGILLLAGLAAAGRTVHHHRSLYLRPLPEKFPSMTIARLSFRQFSAISSSVRFPMFSAGLATSSSPRQPLPCSCATIERIISNRLKQKG